MWEKIEWQMRGSNKRVQMQVNSVLNSYENFHAREGESLEQSYAWLCTALNDLRRHKIQKSNVEINLKFINNLRPEWRKYTISYKDLHDTDIHALVDNLTQFQEEIDAKMAKKKAIATTSSDPLAFHAERRSRSVAQMVGKEDSDEEEGKHADRLESSILEIQNSLALLTQSINKKFGRNLGSSNS